jgi:ribokinase
MVACVGADSHGQTVRASLAAAGVDTALVRTDNERETGVAVVLVAPNGENAIAVSPGANHALVAADVREVAAGLGPADVLLTQLEIPQRVVVDAIDAAAGAGSRTVLNLAPAMSVPSDTLGQLDVLIVNRSEAEFLLGRALPGLDVCRAGAAELHTRGPAAVILTMGADGAIIADSTGARHVPALKAEVVDTAGAGDAFVGAFCAALAAGRPLDDAVAAAARAAAAAVSSPGAQLSARDNHGRRDNR